MTGKCEHCGFELEVMAETQQAANEAAAAECGCSGVRIAQKRERMREELQSLIGADCKKLDFNPVEESTYLIIEHAAEAIINGKIRQATFKVDGTDITIKGGDKIKVSRKYTYEQSGEIE